MQEVYLGKNLIYSHELDSQAHDYKHNKEFKADDLMFGNIAPDMLYLGDELIFLRNASLKTLELKTAESNEISYTYNNVKKTVSCKPDSVYTEYILTEATDLSHFLSSEDNVREVVMLPTLKNVQRMEYFIYNCKNIERLDFTDNVPESCKTFRYTFSTLPKLNSLNISSWRIVDEELEGTGFMYFLYNCNSLVDFYPPYIMAGSFVIGAQKLSVESAIRVINALKETTYSDFIYFHEDVYNQIPEDYIALCTSKGYTISGYHN